MGLVFVYYDTYLYHCLSVGSNSPIIFPCRNIVAYCYGYLLMPIVHKTLSRLTEAYPSGLYLIRLKQAFSLYHFGN